MSWKENALMYWQDPDGQFLRISDHNRQPLSESYERIEHKARMKDGTLRRYSVAKKRTWSTSWTNLPLNTYNGAIRTVDYGMNARYMEVFHMNNDGPFVMILRNGSAKGKPMPTITENTSLPFWNDDFYVVRVMITDFSKDIVKRGLNDLIDLSITLEEV